LRSLRKRGCELITNLALRTSVLDFDPIRLNRTKAQLLFEHDLFRKPVSKPDQVRTGFFGIML